MTKNQVKVVLECNERTLTMGYGEDIDITKITGLEASEVNISTSDNALVDGVSIDGIKLNARTIHIEAACKHLKNIPQDRQLLVKFFNPFIPGRANITHSGTVRNIEYRVEGWNVDSRDGANADSRLKFVVDLYCPDPYMENVDNFGKNMAAISKLFSFPWRMTKERVFDTSVYPPEARGMLLGGQAMGYRTLLKEVSLPNDGDVPTGVMIKFIATRGPVKNPMIKNVGTDEMIRVVVDLKKGDVLTVDTNKRHQVIELNGVNVYQKIDRRSQSFQLAVGDNYLMYDADDNYTNLDVNLYYTPKYLGV